MSDDVKGLPDVPGLENLEGLESAVTSDKGATVPEKPQEQVQATPDKTPRKEQQRNELGQFKSQEDLMKAYKEIQGFSTRMAQEKKATEEQLAQLQEQVELSQFRQPAMQAMPQKPANDFDSLFIQNPQAAVATVASQAVQEQLHRTTIANVLSEEEAKNPQEYQERFSYANQISRAYPQLISSAPGVRKLFALADRYRKVDYEKKGMAFVKALVGDDVDFEKFKSAVRKDQTTQTDQTNNAYMPDTTSSRNGTESEKSPSSHEADIQAAVQKGDPDAVLNAQFRALGLRR